jgi:copper chaperone CopZ
LGPFLAVFRPVAALLTGVFGGGLVHAVDRDDEPASVAALATAVGEEGCDEGCSPNPAAATDGACCDDSECAGNRSDGEPRIVAALRYGLVTLPRDIGKALLVGVLLSGVISAVVEPAALEGVLGRGLLPILLAMAVGVPLYVCATASVPIAVAMIHAGLSPGAALAFLISGPATNGATLTTLWRVLGWKSMVAFLVTVAVGAIGSGLLVDGVVVSGLVPSSAIVTTADATAHHVHRTSATTVGGVMQQVGAVVLLLVLGNAMRPRRRTEEATMTAGESEETVEISIEGMRCNGCVESVQRALKEIAGVRDSEVRLDEGSARVRGRGFAVQDLLEAVRSLGFEAKA